MQVWSHAAAAAEGIAPDADFFVSAEKLPQLKELWGGVFPAQTVLDPVVGGGGW